MSRTFLFLLLRSLCQSPHFRNISQMAWTISLFFCMHLLFGMRRDDPKFRFSSKTINGFFRDRVPFWIVFGRIKYIHFYYVRTFWSLKAQLIWVVCINSIHNNSVNEILTNNRRSNFFDENAMKIPSKTWRVRTSHCSHRKMKYSLN